MRSNRIRRSWPGFLAAAIVGGTMLAGCGSSQTTGPAENIPKESPVLSTKDSMQEFMKGRNSQQPAAPKQ